MDSVSPQVVAMSREPLAAKMFSRAFGSAAPTLTMVSPQSVQTVSEDGGREYRAVTDRFGRRARRQHGTINHTVVR